MKLTASATLFSHLTFCIAFDSILNQNVNWNGNEKSFDDWKAFFVEFYGVNCFQDIEKYFH